MKEFDVKTKVYFGVSALDRLYDIPYSRVFVVADPFTVHSDLIHHVTHRLRRIKVEYTVYDDVVPDPPVESVVDGVRHCLRRKPCAIRRAHNRPHRTPCNKVWVNPCLFHCR